jgi:heptosyltransferase III
VSRTDGSEPVFWIVHLGALGDWILTWPSLLAVRDSVPGVRMIGVGRPDFMRLARRFGVVDGWEDGESREWIGFFSGNGIPDGREMPSAAILWMTGDSAPVRLLRAVSGVRVAAVNPVPEGPACPVFRRHAESVSRQLGIAVPGDFLRFLPDPPPCGRHAFVHPGSGGLRKVLPTRFYGKLPGLLRAHGFDRTVFLLGPAERERGLEAEFEGEEWILPDSACGLADWLTNAALYIGNDSGVSHLAAFMGLPSIVLYTVTDPAMWGALGRRVLHLAAPDPETAERGIAGALDAGFVPPAVTAETRFSP